MKTGRVFLVFVLFAGLLVSCAGGKLGTADAQFARGEYFDAAATYRKIYAKTSPRKERALRGKIAFKMATCYRRMNAASRAAGAYQNAIRYRYPDSTAYFYLARSLQMQGKYKDAIKNYQQFLEYKPNDVLSRNGIKGCELAPEWKKNPTRYVVRRADLFNSRRSDCCPMYLGSDYDQLYFTSSTEKATGTRKSEITGTKNNDVFFSKKDERGAWTRPEPVEGDLNSDLDEGIVSFDPEGTLMYLTKAPREPNTDTSVGIYTSSRTGAKWTTPQKFEITGDTISVFAHPAVSPDGAWLYFVSDMPGGYGGKDIWRIALDGSEGTLENLGPQINTAGDEMFPYIRDNGELYFSSDGHPGMGGLDIFRATKNEMGVWKIENMQAPVNSMADDFGITFGRGENGFFSSNRNDARGYDHIYSFELPQIEVWIEGGVYDNDEEPVAGAVIRAVGKDGSNQKVISRKDGSYKFKLDLGTDYVMMAGCRGFLNSNYELTTDSEEKNRVYRADFILASLTKPVLIENIFYDFDRATLRPESKEALDELIKLLNDNPNVTIELAAHTDMMGSELYNQRLSERRAQSVVDYLIKGGIHPDRLTPKGYGESVPKTITKKMAKQYPFFQEGDV
ncbi:MAG: OmpA family protein, partial [Coprobacter sp.]|nr:OmpA family protein [Coprobacter sp.]